MTLAITEININQVFPRLMLKMKMKAIHGDSRNGLVLEYPEPVSLTYTSPKERILFMPDRDCNPFFHLMDALWMLNGNNDVETLALFCKNIKQYSDNGETFHGAYGKRMKNQKELFINIIRVDHNTRRAVLQIWDWSRDLGANKKDIPCNDLIFARILDGLLHFTVCNRSNDIIWGMCGSNVVQFSILLEYYAAMTGFNIGSLTQFSNNAHVYLDNPQTRILLECYYTAFEAHDLYRGNIPIIPLVTNKNCFDTELSQFMIGVRKGVFLDMKWHNSFFEEVAIPMVTAYQLYRLQAPENALDLIEDRMINCDWKIACTQWLNRRIK